MRNAHVFNDVTAMILTFNEQPNIRRTLEKLAWPKEVLVIDSFSTDETCEIARSALPLRIVQRPFTSFADQCNFGLTQISTSWVLSLDADYVLSDELIAEIQGLQPADGVAGYRVRFRYCVNGTPLRASLYPPRAVLYRKDRARYEDDGHGHRVRIDGRIVELRGTIFHNDRKPLSRWLTAQQKYARMEATKLLAASAHDLKFADRIRRKIIIAPALVFFYTLLGRGLILDGWAGWSYVFQRTLAELILSLHLIEAKLCRHLPSNSASTGERDHG